MKLWLWFFCGVAAVIAVEDNYAVDDVIDQLAKWALNKQNETESRMFYEMIESMSLKEYGHKLPKISLADLPVGKQKRTCTLCKASMQAMFDAYRRDQISITQITTLSVRLCLLMTGYEESDCKGIVDLNLPIFIYIIDHEPRANAGSFCGLIYESKDASDCPLEDERFEFTIEIPERSHNVERKNSLNTGHEAAIQPLKILHLTDAHIDPLYEPGAPAHCNSPCCCRKGQKATSKTTKAGYWGDYGTCDTPLWAFHDILDHITDNNKDIDYIYFTGDIIDHAVGETTYESCAYSIKYVSQKFIEYFGSTPLYPIIGNHESQPMGVFAPENITTHDLSTSWLYTLLAEEWSQWLPKEQMDTFKTGGYYSILVRPGFRVVALNTNVAYRYNWWVVLNPNDPNGHLKWLVKTLWEAEKAGEIVHILSHIPPGYGEIYGTWNREYKKIISRFSHIITAEFNGHMHTDEIKIYYDDDDIDKPTHIAWNGGGMVTFISYNVNYKVMKIDPVTYIPLDIDTYIYNITEANETPDQKPRWFKSYSFREAYELDTLEAKDVDKMVHEMATTRRDLLSRYIHHFGKGGDEFLGTVTSGRDERGEEYDFDYICNIVTTSTRDSRKCDQMREKFFAKT